MMSVHGNLEACGIDVLYLASKRIEELMNNRS
jgi:hypothetical protein